VTLVEECDDFVASFEALHIFADGYDGAGTIGARNFAVFRGKRIFALLEVLKR